MVSMGKRPLAQASLGVRFFCTRLFIMSFLFRNLRGTVVEAPCGTWHVDKIRIDDWWNLLTINDMFSCDILSHVLKPLFFLRLRSHSVHPLTCGQARSVATSCL